jgi:hypothetical protein
MNLEATPVDQGRDHKPRKTQTTTLRRREMSDDYVWHSPVPRRHWQSQLLCKIKINSGQHLPCSERSGHLAFWGESSRQVRATMDWTQCPNE